MAARTGSVQTERQFFWSWLLRMLATPYVLLLVLAGKRPARDLLWPLVLLVRFLFEPKMTLTLIVITVASFIGSVFLPETILAGLVLYPSDLFAGKLYTLITSGFLHANLLHLFSNMLGLFIFGRIVERSIGPIKMLGIYLSAMALGGIFYSLTASFLLHDSSGAIGASGALLGLVSAAMLLDPLYVVYLFGIPMPVMILAWLTIFADITGILQGVDDGIAHFAHLGGFLSIGLLMFFLGGRTRTTMKKGLILNIVSITIFALAYVVWQAVL